MCRASPFTLENLTQDMKHELVRVKTMFTGLDVLFTEKFTLEV